MDAIEHLAEHVWKHPRDYGGFSPDGDYVILTRTRDSDTLDRSNWECIARDMGARTCTRATMAGFIGTDIGECTNEHT